MSWIRRETEKETVQYICPHCHDYHEFREDFGERTFSENYIFCRRCGARNGTGNAPTLTPPNEWVSVEERLPDKELEDFKRKYPGENKMEVIVHIVGAKEPTVLKYDGECFADALTGEYHITHWMPLPALPDSQKKGEKRMIRLRELREKRGLSMKDAADLLNMPYTTYVNYEKGTLEPNIQALFRLANFFGVSIDDLLGRCAPNEPLTLEQLREMDGEAIYWLKNKMWLIVYLNHPDFGDCAVNRDGQYLKLEHCEKRKVYRRPPEGEEDML